jgi:cytochrome c553
MKKIALTLLVTGACTFAMAADGAELFKKCTSCHGDKAQNKALGKSAVIQGQDAATTEKQIKAYKDGSLNQYGMGGLMKGQVATLSDDDIKAIATYVAGLQ